MISQTRISVIVPHYNDHQRCERLVSEMLRLYETSAFFELIVVDNGSSHPLELPDHPALLVLHCATPGSYAARNLGVQNARGAILAFTDSDCLPDVKWLAAISDFFAVAENANKILAGRINMYAAKQGAENLFEAYDCLLGLDQENYVRRGYAITANIAFQRCVYDAVGGFDALRFSGGDAAFVREAVRLGYELVYAPDVVVFHPARDSYQEYEKKTRRVVGGQILRGSLSSRLFYTIKNLLPPIVEFSRILRKQSALQVKAKVIGFLLLLWYMRATNTMRVWIFRSHVAR